MLEKLNADLESAYGAMDDAVRAEDYASASAWEDRIQDLRMRRLVARRHSTKEGKIFSLTYPEACVVVDALNGVILTLGDFGIVDADEFLTREVRGAINLSFLDRWHGADKYALMKKLHGMTEDQAGDLLDAVHRFWEGVSVCGRELDVRSPHFEDEVRERLVNAGIIE